MSSPRLILNVTAMVAVVGAGFIMWNVIGPGEDRQEGLHKNPGQSDETRRRNALMMQVLKDAAETHDNIARGSSGPAK